jgi:Coenzyme PQQ synthesis protein D (PqqD)
MTAGTTGRRIRRRPGVLWRCSLDAVVLLPPGAPDVITLAGTGPVVWQLLAEWRSADELAEMLAAAYGSTPDVVVRDLGPLLRALEVAGALESAADSGRDPSG